MLSRHYEHREVAYLFTSLSRRKDSKILTLIFLSGEVKSDFFYFLKNISKIFYHFIIQTNVGQHGLLRLLCFHINNADEYYSHRHTCTSFSMGRNSLNQVLELSFLERESAEFLWNLNLQNC